MDASNPSSVSAVTSEIASIEYKVVVTATEPFILTSGDGGVSANSVEVTVSTDGRGSLRPVGTFYVVRGRQVGDDGQVTRRPRLLQGNNLIRLPEPIRTEVRAAVAHLGLDDLRGQLSGMTFDRARPAEA